ncbi:MAG: EAL domain-containing protein [Candidatus Izimaplasma sp.]|nr:EAL domain-containing protein [Candidatus Izimaplasma bacterium]
MIEYEDLEKIAYTDMLTGLRNLSGLMRDYYAADLRDVHFVYLDIDDFNKMTAIFGTDAIDDMLLKVAKTMKDYCGKADVYRIGADQFITVSDSSYICEPDQLHKILKQPIKHYNVQILVNASICVLHYNDFDGASLEDVLKLMHFSIDESKQKYRNALILADDALKARFMDKKNIELNIYEAVKEGHFFPKFKPFIDTFNGKVLGFETVSRWQYEDREIKPDKFLSISEYTGLIYDIEMKMFEETVKFFKEIETDKKIKVHRRFNASLNFSEYTLIRVKIDDLFTILDKYQVFAKNIIIEIKESIITDPEAYNKIKKLHEAGFLIALDEYSNNNSSLTYLVDLKVDILKLDESLLDNIDNDQEYTRMHSVYKFIVDIGRKLNLTVISTGINNKIHLKLVKDLEINVGSGECFSRAVKKNEFISYLKSNQKVCS